MLVTLLRGKELVFYSNLPVTAPENYSRLKEKMNARFGNKDQPEASDVTAEKLTIEAFLNGATNQEAVIHVRNREPKSLDVALRLMKVHVLNMGGIR